MSKYKTLASNYEISMIEDCENITDAVMNWKCKVREIARVNKIPLSQAVFSLVNEYNNGLYSVGVVRSATGYLYAKYFM